MSDYSNNMCIIPMIRKCTNKFGTFGELYWDGLVFQTLEPKMPIIPLGSYLVNLTYSPRFGCKSPYTKFNGLVPLISGVAGHEGIRIHVGNYVNDTQGCILVGMSTDETILFESRKAYVELMTRIQARRHYNPNTFYVLKVTEKYE